MQSLSSVSSPAIPSSPPQVQPKTPPQHPSLRVPFEIAQNLIFCSQREYLKQTLTHEGSTCELQYEKWGDCITGKALLKMPPYFVTYQIYMGKLDSIEINQRLGPHLVINVGSDYPRKATVELQLAQIPADHHANPVDCLCHFAEATLKLMPESFPTALKTMMSLFEQNLPGGISANYLHTVKRIHRWYNDHSLCAFKEINGVLQGNAWEFDATGTLEFKHLNGKREGDAFKQYYNGNTARFAYKNDHIHGRATLEIPKRLTLTQEFEEGQAKAPPQITVKVPQVPNQNPYNLFFEASFNLKEIVDSHQPMKTKIIHVNMPSGKNYTFHCSGRMMIWDLKYMLSVLEYIPSELINIVLNQLNLPNDTKIEDTKIKNGSTFDLVQGLIQPSDKSKTG